MVEPTGFEPATTWSQTTGATRLRYGSLIWWTVRESNPPEIYLTIGLKPTFTGATRRRQSNRPNMAGVERLELPTQWLTATCSAN